MFFLYPGILTSTPLTLAEAQVRQCESIRQGALMEVGIEARPERLHNASRDAYRCIHRFGIGWRVGLDVVTFRFDDDTTVHIHYLHPRKLLQYLLEKKPDVIHGGNPQSIGAFWNAYKLYHGSHEVFVQHDDLSRVIPVCIHGDEGRGKRRSQTTVVSFESVLGMKGDPTPCNECRPQHLVVSQGKLPQELQLSQRLCCNLKGHSFLQHFPLFVIPGTWWKTYKTLTHKMLQHVAEDFEDLFNTGFQIGNETWYVACVGSKADLKWHGKICRLTRGYENKSTVQDVPHCHVCLAGSPQLPAEDLGNSPVWVPTCYVSRPWAFDDVPALDRIPFDPNKPEFLYKHDIFHTLRLGIFRDFCGSTLFMLIRLGYFRPGDIGVQLESAHGHFHLWQLANRKRASLRSFSKGLLSYKSAKSFPWFNVKGSDCFLLLKWIRTLVVGLLNDCNDASHLRPLRISLSTCEMAINFYDMVSHHNMFLSKHCAAKLIEKGRSFINGYVWLADFAFSMSWCLYALKPKLHFTRHLVLELEQQLHSGSELILSPLLWDCCQNEDFIGRTCRVARKIDERILCRRVLENYLIKAGILYDREVKKRRRTR